MRNEYKSFMNNDTLYFKKSLNLYHKVKPRLKNHSLQDTLHCSKI